MTYVYTIFNILYTYIRYLLAIDKRLMAGKKQFPRCAIYIVDINARAHLSRI